MIFPRQSSRSYRYEQPWQRARRIGAHSRHAMLLASCALLLFVALSLAPGCGSAGLSDPAAIVRQAVAAQDRLESVHMEMDGTIEITGAGAGHVADSYKVAGDYLRPDRSKVSVSSGTGDTEVVTIGKDTWVRRVSKAAAWSRKAVPGLKGGSSPSDVTNYLKYTQDLVLADSKDDAYHLTFVLDMGRYAKVAHLPGVDASAFRGTQSDMEVWVNRRTFNVQRAKMEFGGNLASIGAGNVAMTVDVEFSAFNKPVQIEAPI